MQSLRTALGKSVIHFLINKDKTNSVEHIYQVVRPFLNNLWVQKLSSWIHICHCYVWLNVCLWCKELPLSLRPPSPLGQLLLVLQLNPCASKQWPLESDISPWDTQILPSKHSHNTTSTSLWGKKTSVYLPRDPCFPNRNKFISPPHHSHSHSLPLPFTASGGFPRRPFLHSSSALTEPGGSAALPSQAGLRTLPISQPRHRLAARLQGRGKSAAERAGSHAASVPLLQGRALLGRGSTVLQFQKATYLPSDTHKKSNQDFKHSNLHVE